MVDRDKVREVPFAEKAAVRQEVQEEIDAVNWLLRKCCRQLATDSATVKAIRREATWEEILNLARWEEAWEVTELLEEARVDIGADLPAGVRCRLPG